MDAIAESFVQRLRKGDYPSISEYVAKHPDLEDEIRAVFPTLAMLEKFSDREETSHLHFGTAGTPDRLGEYRIIREVARGGMGIVYEAEHDTMRRRVALKVLPTTLASSSTQLHRFHREARAAGRLHHTNIVPVFEVGVDRGLHFYAMQFIQGQSLDVVFDELRRLKSQSTSVDPLRTAEAEATTESAAVDLARDLASGLLSGQFRSASAANCDDDIEQGEKSLDGPKAESNSPRQARIRDEPHEATAERAKPVNPQTASLPASSSDVAVDARLASSSAASGLADSEEGYYRRVARIGLQAAEAMSFAHSQGVLHRDIKPANIILDASGVAWLTDFGLAKNEEGNLTLTGDIVGTLRYMSPERFSGESDARSDIYGLGVTLYEMATLQVAFPQTDRANLMRVITHEDPVRPRRVNRRIPRDLETIVLKAIDRQPQRRYQVAEELASDLRRFLSDRPILARRLSATERIWRICRRNPVSAMLSFCLLLLMVVVVAGSLWFGYINRRQADELRVTIFHAKEAERVARNSERKATSHFYDLCLGRAESGRWSGRMGQRFESLRSLAQAADLLPTLKRKPDDERAERLTLRNLAVSAMALVDLRVDREWPLSGEWTSIAAFDENAARMAVSDINGNILIRSAAVGGRLIDDPEGRILPSPGERAWEIRFSPNGRYLAAKYHPRSNASKAMVVLWDVERGAEVSRLDSELNRGRFRFSGDSLRFAVARKNGEVSIFSTSDGEIQETLRVGGDAFDIAFDEAGRQMAVCAPNSNSVQIWKLGAEPVVLHRLETQATPTVLEWNTSKSMLAAGCSDGSLLVWRDGEFKLAPQELEPHQEARVTRIGFDRRCELLASYAWDGTTRINDLRTGQPVLRIDGLKMLASGFSADGQLGFEREDSQLGVWRLPSSRPFFVLTSNVGAPRGETAFHPIQQNLLASATTEGVELWDVATRSIVEVIPTRVRSRIRFTPDGKSMLTSESGQEGIRKWPLTISTRSATALEVTLGEPLQLRSGRSERIWLNGQGTTVAVDTGPRDALLVDTQSGESRRVGQHGGLDHVCLTPDGKSMITSTWHGSGVLVWDTASGMLVRRLAPHWGSATITLSDDGRRLAGASGQQRGVWAVDGWRELRLTDRVDADNWPGPLCFSHDGRLLANARTRYVPQIVNANSGEDIVVLQAPNPKGVGALSFSKDDRYLAINNEQSVHVWDLKRIRVELKAMQLDWNGD